ncbi:hypothetical protein Cob_v006122 [Colletotrichum orbiculare MAFF 240422]|uniref:Uncharacterized protein n=1 Tax=Colletotrichum orbiculare (strain 104-T / ATCC 96160 / CBS 514.97 / LARS 414 / MAFF 240422) TaxID=1213857 RepID=A0A484FRC9_COLOR|nr:hypothetical protein Cob_v006122 [Colletotrichum orbiculare MAFF 240422]
MFSVAVESGSRATDPAGNNGHRPCWIRELDTNQKRAKRGGNEKRLQNGSPRLEMTVPVRLLPCDWTAA